MAIGVRWEVWYVYQIGVQKTKCMGHGFELQVNINSLKAEMEMQGYRWEV